MNNIKTIADFKRALTIGSYWQATHRYIDNNPTPVKNMGIRKCVLNNTVDFGFLNQNTSNTSHCQWPKKTQFSTRDNGNIVVITTKFCELTYMQIN